MGLTSQMVHRLGGVAFTLVALLLILRRLQIVDAGWIEWLLPLLFVGYGVESFLDLWIHGAAVPMGYAAESRQHVAQGAIALTAGVVEALILTGTLRPGAWSAVLLLALVVIGTVFLLHAPHGGGNPMQMMAQHRAFAIALYVAAVAKGLASVSVPQFKVFETAWLLPLLVFGLLMLVYTEPSDGAIAHGMA